MKLENISILLKKNIDETLIFDLHTHLFPPQHKNYYLSGLKEVLNYHYLVAELLTITDVSIKYFNSLNIDEKANLIWEELFINRTPMSEACQGVLTILSNFSISIKNKTYKEIDKELADINYSDKEILIKSNVQSLVMTNNPFDENEWSLFDNHDWDRKIYLSSLRLDNLMFDFNSALQIAKKKINSGIDDVKKIIQYLEYCYNVSNPVYAALSLNLNDLKDLLVNNLWLEILNWLKSKKLPLSLMLGVKRAVNKDLGQAGDGIGDIDLKDLSKLCIIYPGNKFLVTCLSLNSQHELIVLARKHSNLKIFGFWWFMNQPSIIELVLKMRIDLLGLSFIPQHSDARITDQLIYKWAHFKKILQKVLLEYYIKLNDNGFSLNEDIIKRDIKNLLQNNAKKTLNIKS